jgi:hypothetical protein
LGWGKGAAAIVRRGMNAVAGRTRKHDGMGTLRRVRPTQGECTSVLVVLNS